MLEGVRSFSIKPLVAKAPPTQIEVLIVMNSKIMCELSTINLSVQKKYFIMSESYYSEIKKKYIRMFDEIIVLENNTTSAVLDVFESIWQK